ncbi:HGL293Wp [Eremothecium sinecaudum]|uniref:Adenylate kinase isoenzyme 6 homolog n=1 Tax=Eremothecium sinecaudum TaxID=45286 RepID=A0A0X8HV61_9SACH|nr:HGL293Wp [Eremothecium sinecaudum]AMD22047.1 HGL293Wp [Eremothecium sinecaudum]
MTKRFKPNIIISGTPGCGKTTICKLLKAKLDNYKYYNISDFAKEQNCYEGYDEERKSHIVDEDKLLDILEAPLRLGGNIIDWHVNDIFPERLIDLVVVLRCDNSILYSRLQERNYHDSKIEENIDAEIMGVVLQDARDSYVPDIVVELQSNTEEDMENNADRIVQWIENWVKDHPDGATNELDHYNGIGNSTDEDSESDGDSDTTDGSED